MNLCFQWIFRWFVLVKRDRRLASCEVRGEQIWDGLARRSVRLSVRLSSSKSHAEVRNQRIVLERAGKLRTQFCCSSTSTITCLCGKKREKCSRFDNDC